MMCIVSHIIIYSVVVIVYGIVLEGHKTCASTRYILLIISILLNLLHFICYKTDY